MVLGLLAKYGAIVGGIVLFVLFVFRAKDVGIGNAASEVGSGIGNIGLGIGTTGTGIKTFGEGIGGSIIGLFKPLEYLKGLIFGGNTSPTAAAANNNSPTASVQTPTEIAPSIASPFNLAGYLSNLQQNQKNLGGQSALNTLAQNRSISIARGVGTVTNSSRVGGNSSPVHRVSVRGGFSSGSASTQARRSAGQSKAAARRSKAGKR